MGILQVAGIGILSAVLVLCLRELRATLALPARLAATLVLLGACVLLYVPVLTRLRALFALSDGADYATPVLRATGIALICEFSAGFCRDMGENTVANGIALFGKLEILVLSLPLIDAVLDIAKELLNF